MLSKAPSKHAEEKGLQALSPTGVRAILDVASNFARQFSPQSRGCRPRSWLPLTKELLQEPPPYILLAYSCTRQPEARARVRNLPWGIRHCLHLGKHLPGGSLCSPVPRDRLRTAEGLQSPCTPRGSGAHACPDPRALGGAGGPAAEGRGEGPRGPAAPRCPAAPATSDPPKGKGEGLCRGAAGPSPTPFLPPASRGAAPEQLQSRCRRGPDDSALPSLPAAGWCCGPPRPAPRRPGSDQRPMAPAPSRRNRRVRPSRVPSPASGSSSGPGTPGTAEGSPARSPKYVPSEHCPRGSWRNPLPFHPARCLTKHRIMKRVKINPTC